MKRKHIDNDYIPSAYTARKILEQQAYFYNFKENDQILNRPKRTRRASAIKANEIICQKVFIPQKQSEEKLPLKADLQVVETISNINIGLGSSCSSEDEENLDETKPKTIKSKVKRKLKSNNNQKKQAMITHIKNAKMKKEQAQKEKKKLEEIQEINEKHEDALIKIRNEMKKMNDNDLLIFQLFQKIEREYEEKIKMLTEKCFLLECKCNQLLNERNEKTTEERENIVELEPIYEFGGLSPPSSPQMEMPIIELTPPSPPSPTHSFSQEEKKDVTLNYESDGALSQEMHDDESVSSDSVQQTPQKRRVGLILEDPMEMHINSSPSLSDTSSEVDFSWLFEQQLMPPPSSPLNGSPTLSTSSANDLASDSNSNSGSGTRRSSRRGEKRQKIESILNRLRTEMHASILLPNLILNEYVHSEISKDASLEHTPTRGGSAVKRSSLSSEHVYTDRNLKLKDKSYVRTNYSYRGIELPENLIFFCKFLKFDREYSHEKYGLSNIRFNVIDLIDTERKKYRFLKSNNDGMIIGDCSEGLIVVKIEECESSLESKVISKLNNVLVSKQTSRRKRLIREFCFGSHSLAMVFDFDFPIYILRDEKKNNISGPYSLLEMISECV